MWSSSFPEGYLQRKTDAIWIFNYVSYIFIWYYDRTQVSAIDVVTKLRHRQSRNCGCIPSRGQQFFLSLTRRGRLWSRTELIRKRVASSFPGGIFWRYDADHSPPYSEEIKNYCSSASVPSYTLISCIQPLPQDYMLHKYVIYTLETLI